MSQLIRLKLVYSNCLVPDMVWPQWANIKTGKKFGKRWGCTKWTNHYGTISLGAISSLNPVCNGQTMYRGVVVEPDLRGGYPVRGGEGVVSGEGCPSIAQLKIQRSHILPAWIVPYSSHAIYELRPKDHWIQTGTGQLHWAIQVA